MEFSDIWEEYRRIAEQCVLEGHRPFGEEYERRISAMKNVIENPEGQCYNQKENRGT